MKPIYHSSRSASRRAFTLVEVLVVMLIMAVLASMALFALVNTLASAKEAKTRSTIAKINALIMPKYESYLTRRVPVDVLAVAISEYGVPAGTELKDLDPKIAARVRLDALRELMRMEMPDRWHDVTDNPSRYDNSAGQNVVIQPLPSATQAYRDLMGTTPPPNDPYESAECLYLIITAGLDEPDVMENFSANEIGDVDKDGRKEFIDGWGQPISWLRWAPAIRSELQNGTDPDPFDPMRVYPIATQLSESRKPLQTQPTFLLHPFIYSGGPDTALKIWPGNNGFSYQARNNDPFVEDIGVPSEIGKSQDDDGDGTANDNITNHSMSVR